MNAKTSGSSLFVKVLVLRFPLYKGVMLGSFACFKVVGFLPYAVLKIFLFPKILPGLLAEY